MEGKLYGNRVTTEWEANYNSVGRGYEDRRRVTLECSYDEYALVMSGLLALRALCLQKTALDKSESSEKATRITTILSEIQSDKLQREPGSEKTLHEYR